MASKSLIPLTNMTFGKGSLTPPLVFTRSDFGGGQILGPPQAKNFGVFWAFLRGKRFKNGTILVQKSDDPRD